MEYCSWKDLSSKYIFKKILSYINIPKALNIIKINKKIQTNFKVTLFHYQYYYFFSLFKTTKIETIKDILESPYLENFSEDVRYDLILKLIENRKLFKDKYAYIKIEDKNSIDFLKKLKEKKINNCLNHIIGNIEQEYFYDNVEPNYNKNIYNIFSTEIIDRILFDYNFFSTYNNIISKQTFQSIKFLHINIDPTKSYNISSLDNLEYLSITLIQAYKIYSLGILTIKIILTEKQMKNLKTLKIIESGFAYFRFKDIIIETENNNREKIFANLNELDIREELLNKIKFDSKKIKKLNILYDFRDKIYSIDNLQNSINNLLEQYLNLTSLKISFFYLKDFNHSSDKLIQEISNFFFDLNTNVSNYSLKFWDLYENRKILRLNIKILPNRKFKLIGNDLTNDIYQNYLNIIENIELTFNNKKQCNLYIEENSSMSALKKISINQGIEDTLYFPIKSFNSLNSLKFNIDKINFVKEFPLFSTNCLIIFHNLEYINLNTETIDVIITLYNNFHMFQI